MAVAAAVLFVLAGIAGGARAQIQVPDAAQAQYMVTNTLVALNHANLTGNYTVLRDLGSLRFRANNTAARLAAVFAGLRDEGIDMAPIVMFDAQFAAPPNLDDQGRLRLVGQFPTQPLRIVFDIAYELTGNRWSISDISVNAVEWPEEEEEVEEEEQGSMQQPQPTAELPRPRPRPLQ